MIWNSINDLWNSIIKRHLRNANYIVNSIVCAVILVLGSRVRTYGIRPMHGPIHVLDMHGTGTKHIVRHNQKSVVQWSDVAEFTCILRLRIGSCKLLHTDFHSRNE